MRQPCESVNVLTSVEVSMRIGRSKTTSLKSLPSPILPIQITITYGFGYVMRQYLL